MLRNVFFRFMMFSFVVLILTACSPYFYQPLGEEHEAQLGPETPMKKDLLDLPSPKEPIVVAVYKFRDQTGQYKPSNVGASWSTAVTQGATNILIRALEESGWFIPIERENISNLLNERKIIRSSREQYEGSSGVMLPPLLFAGVLLEGGIVSYETNVYTGGAGARYFGTDVSAQYREDRVSIYLRAVSTSNGKILKTVYTTKSILSQEVSMGVFRYVKFKRLLEAETGYTYNEPTEMAVTEAVEKAVHSLIIEGVLENLWTLEKPEEIGNAEIQNYRQEKEDALEFDHIGQPFEQTNRTRFYNALKGSAQFCASDYSSKEIRGGGSLGVGFGLTKSFFLETNFGIQSSFIEDVMVSTEYFSDINLKFLANPEGKFSPYLAFGGGTFYDGGNAIGLSDKLWLPYLTYTGGTEYLLTNRLAITGELFVKQLFTDYYDGEKAGSFNDHILGVQLGMKFYIGKN
ncbi:CsgG/HfaB family protein [uncultured Draconibacterium sp.]|uniref:CsgG/HfaB family protein n=1 Tax=uncultured Draconibacterium sp. TaxID=1573823 RepID=UPI0029C94BE0|nr:CsgG/HfaB family protein [uncultured Draconibacterium sp.]